MIRPSDIRKLADWPPRPESPVLSVYLDVDQSKAVNLNRGFEASLKHMLQSIEGQLEDKQARTQFQEDAGRVWEFMARYEPHGKGLVLFCDASEDFWWHHEVRAPLLNDAHWAETPYLRPLLELLDEYERYGVILTDHKRSRLFTVFMGEIEEHHDAFARAPVRHLKTTGTDRMWSQMHFQRRSEVHAKWHLKHVAEMMAHLADEYALDRLILAGTVEATGELRRLLPKRLESKIVAVLPLAVEAKQHEVLEETLAVEERVERERERRLVEELIVAAEKGQQAVLGLEATIVALQEHRIWRLVYAEGYRAPGAECANCGELVAGQRQACPYCGGSLIAIEDLVERAGEKVFELGNEVEQVRGEAAARLRECGRIGAYLRW